MKVTARLSLERLASLDRAIRAGEYPNARTIASLLEVGHRTVQRDVEFLRDRLGAPLAFDRRRNGYFYSEPDYRLPLLTLTKGELVALFLAERVLQQYRGTPYAADLSRAFSKITADLSGQVTVDLAHLDRAHSFRTTSASDLPPEVFAELDSAIRGRHRLAILYYSASRDEEAAREVDPYHLASIDGQWFLVGHCHLRGEVRMFVPGRIRSMVATDGTFEPPADFRIDAYLAGSLSILRGVAGEEHHVRLRFTGDAMKYMRERVCHPSQTLGETPGVELILGLTVGHLREVERLALSWGASCEVLEPPGLRERVAKELVRAADRYRSTARREP